MIRHLQKWLSGKAAFRRCQGLGIPHCVLFETFEAALAFLPQPLWGHVWTSASSLAFSGHLHYINQIAMATSRLAVSQGLTGIRFLRRNEAKQKGSRNKQQVYGETWWEEDRDSTQTLIVPYTWYTQLGVCMSMWHNVSEAITGWYTRECVSECVDLNPTMIFNKEISSNRGMLGKGITRGYIWKQNSMRNIFQPQ